MYKNSCLLNLSLAISCMSKDSIIKIKDNGVLILLIIELNGTIKINKRSILEYVKSDIRVLVMSARYY